MPERLTLDNVLLEIRIWAAQCRIVSDYLDRSDIDDLVEGQVESEGVRTKFASNAALKISFRSVLQAPSRTVASTGNSQRSTFAIALGPGSGDTQPSKKCCCCLRLHRIGSARGQERNAGMLRHSA
jgi:hypothetical protein